MPLYEHVFLARQDVTAQQVEELTAQFKGIIEQAGGKVEKTEYWGVKSLSYRMRKNRKAHFTLLNVDAPPAALAEVERQQRLNEDILRFMTIHVEALEEAQSAILSRKSDERERGFRGPKPAGRFESGRRRGYDEREEFRARDDFAVPDFRAALEE